MTRPNGFGEQQFRWPKGYASFLTGETWPLAPPENQCTTTSRRTGQRCKLPAMRGVKRCSVHGGRADQEKLGIASPAVLAMRRRARKARERLRVAKRAPAELRQSPAWARAEVFRPWTRRGLQAALVLGWEAMQAGRGRGLWDEALKRLWMAETGELNDG